MLGRIEGGITGINERLDRLNGSVVRHEERVTGLEKRSAFDKGRNVKDHSMTAGISAVVTGVLTFFYTHFK